MNGNVRIASNNAGGLVLEVAATFADISVQTNTRFIKVVSDTYNNDDKSLYLYSAGLLFLVTPINAP